MAEKSTIKDKQASSQAVVSSVSKRDRLIGSIKRRKKLTLTLLVVAAALVVTMFAYMFTAKDSGNNEVINICTGDFLAEVNSQLNMYTPPEESKLSTLVSEIEQKPGYEKDLKCIYPVTVSYAWNGEYDKPKSNIDLMKPIYDEELIKQNFDAIYSLEELTTLVDANKTAIDAAHENAIIFDTPPEVNQ